MDLQVSAVGAGAVGILPEMEEPCCIPTLMEVHQPDLSLCPCSTVPLFPREKLLHTCLVSHFCFYVWCPSFCQGSPGDTP